MIVVYRPELESPPMDKECTIGFSFLSGKGNPDYIQVAAGVNRGFSEKIWDQIKDYDVVKNLLNLGALRIEADASADAKVSSEAETVDQISDLPIDRAMRLIEDSFDVAQLTRWDAKEARIRVKNALTRRITAITEGNG